MPALPPIFTSHRKRRWAAQNLAARLLSRPWTLPSMDGALRATLGKLHPRTSAALGVRIFELGEDRYPPAPQTLTAWLLRSRFFKPKPDQTVAACLDAPLFAPLPPFAGLPVPKLATPAELAAWLGLSAEDLDWFSDERNGQSRARTAQLRHYHHALTRKRSGEPRLLEAPKARLKAIQRRILHEILSAIPVHDCAHGFVAGRCCLTGARIHAGEAVIIRFDLAGFFPSIGAPRIHGIFRSLGYPWAVARHLTGLCTTATPNAVIARLATQPDDIAALRETYGVRHLPQGAPSSPALANLLCWRLDLRLHGLARAAGANYTRYADDLAFSGGDDFAGGLHRFSKAVTKIIAEEGFRLNAAKTRIMPRHTRQCVTGVVVSQHCNTTRVSFDELKATLHNCLRHGPQTQNRAGLPDFRRHLEGQIAWTQQVNPRRAAKLRELFDAITWHD